jgi:DNA-binding transcriptional LysR family regulator
MNLNQLKAFYYVAKYKSITAAADALYVTQPAVTKAIRRLEDYYGLVFLNRFGKKLVPTDAGEVLFRIAEEIFRMDQEADETIRDFQQRRSGHVRVHACETVGAYMLPSIMTDFAKSYSHILTSVVIYPNETVVANTVGFNNDLGFISYPVEHEKIVAKEILEDRLILIVPPHHPFAHREVVQPKDLQGQPLIMHEKGSYTRLVVDEFIAKHRLAVTVPFEISNNEFIKRAVENGLGVSLVSHNVAREEIKAGRLKNVQVAQLSVKRKFYMIYHRDKHFSPPLQALINLLFDWSARYAESLV